MRFYEIFHVMTCEVYSRELATYDLKGQFLFKRPIAFHVKSHIGAWRYILGIALPDASRQKSVEQIVKAVKKTLNLKRKNHHPGHVTGSVPVTWRWLSSHVTGTDQSEAGLNKNCKIVPRKVDWNTKGMTGENEMERWLIPNGWLIENTSTFK